MSSPLLVFGQGPVIDRFTRIKAEDAGTIPGTEDMNFWGHSLAIAAAILYHNGVSSEIVIMGGRTGGDAYASEAELILSQLISYGVPAEVCRLEQSSTNSLENLVNFMNLYLEDDHEVRFQLLGTNYHIERLELLMDLFGISWNASFGSHAVIREAVERGELTQDTAHAIEELSMLDIPLERYPEDRTGFYGCQLGVEQKTYAHRAHEEEAFTRLLLEVPEYWVTYLARVESDVQLQRILHNLQRIFPGYLESFGIYLCDLSNPDFLQLARSIFGPIPRPNIAQWILEEMPHGWPDSTREVLRYFRYTVRQESRN